MQTGTGLLGKAALAVGLVLCGAAHAGLIGQWRFEGNLLDSSGSGHTATFNGGTASYVGATGGQAIALDGVDDFLNVAADGNNLDLDGNSFTISAWLNVHTAQTARRDALVAGKGDFSNLANYALTVDYVNQTDDVTNILTNGYTRKNDGTNRYVESILYWDATEAYVNLVLTYDAPSKTLVLYRNGSLRDSKTDANFSGPINTASDFTMGKGLYTDYLRGDLDEVQVYDFAVNEEQAIQLFNGGNGPVVVPEPAALSLLGLGALALRRRK